MPIRHAAVISAGLCLSLGACTWDDTMTQVKASLGDNDAMVAVTKAAVTPEKMAALNTIPWQLTPASAASVGQGENTVVVDKPGLGRVRGTEKALAELDQRIVPYKGANDEIVSVCKDAFDRQAKQIGAYSLEAAAAGPVRKEKGAGKNQQVFFRSFYADPKDSGVEVRQASVICGVGPHGELLKAAPI